MLLHLSGYVGVPLVREAMLTAKEVFGEMRKGALTETAVRRESA